MKITMKTDVEKYKQENKKSKRKYLLCAAASALISCAAFYQGFIKEDPIPLHPDIYEIGEVNVDVGDFVSTTLVALGGLVAFPATAHFLLKYGAARRRLPSKVTAIETIVDPEEKTLEEVIFIGGKEKRQKIDYDELVSVKPSNNTSLELVTSRTYSGLFGRKKKEVLEHEIPCVENVSDVVNELRGYADGA